MTKTTFTTLSILALTLFATFAPNANASQCKIYTQITTSIRPSEAGAVFEGANSAMRTKGAEGTAFLFEANELVEIKVEAVLESGEFIFKVSAKSTSLKGDTSWSVATGKSLVTTTQTAVSGLTICN